MPKLMADGVAIPREVLNDCDPGDRYDISNATIEQSKSLEKPKEGNKPRSSTDNALAW